MSVFTAIFDVFSRRPKVEEDYPQVHHIPETTRQRILMWCMDLFANADVGGPLYGTGRDVREDFLLELNRRIKFRLGRNYLVHSESRVQEVVDYLGTCSGEEFLDFLEDIFRVRAFFYVQKDPNRAVEELNALLQIDELPYSVTKLVQVIEEPDEGSFGGRPIRVIAHPKVILRDSEFLHLEAVEPALVLLADPTYEAANVEFREALEAFRKGDLQKCLAKCSSAFESVLKIVIARNGWRCDKDTAAPMVQTLISNTSLDAYFDSLLIIIATLRNKMAGVHGAGTAPAREVPRHWAQYAINATAAAILLVVEEAS